MTSERTDRRAQLARGVAITIGAGAVIYNGLRYGPVGVVVMLAAYAFTYGLSKLVERWVETS